MTSSYTVNNGLEKPEAGDQEGAWGGTLKILTLTLLTGYCLALVLFHYLGLLTL